MKKSGIYAWSTPWGRMYVGSSNDIFRRKREHLAALEKGSHFNPLLQRAYDKYGAALTFSVLAYCPAESLLIEEQRFIDATPVKLRMNLALTAGAPSNYRSPEHRRRIGDAHRGKTISPQHRAAVSAARKNHKASAETRALLSAQRRLRKLSEDHAQKLKAGNLKRAFPSRTGFRGVTKNHKGFLARIYARGKTLVVGTYKTPELAFAMRLVFLAAVPKVQNDI